MIVIYIAGCNKQITNMCPRTL